MQNPWIQPIRIRLAGATFPPCLQSCLWGIFYLFSRRSIYQQGWPGWLHIPNIAKLKNMSRVWIGGRRYWVTWWSTTNHWIRRVFPSNVPNVWKENPKILPLFHCLNAPCWMKIGCTFLIPPGHLLTTSTTRSRRPHHVLSPSSPHPPGPGNLCRLQGLTQLWLDQNSIGDAGARRPGVADVVLEQKSSARPPRPELLHRRRSPAIALERQLRGLCQIRGPRWHFPEA